MKKKRDKEMNVKAEKERKEPELKSEEFEPEIEDKIVQEEEGGLEHMIKQKLKERITELEAEKAEATNKYLRTLAEFDNYRKRSSQERINWIRNATEGLVLKLCDVLDDFERAMQNCPDDELLTAFHKGIEGIYKKFETVLRGEGVKKIEADKAEFNPMFHEAIAYTPSNQDRDTIVSVIQNGYIMNDKVIRPARVAVSAGEPDEPQGADDSDEKEESSNQ